MKRLQDALVVAASAFGVIPGLAVLKTGIGTPPDAQALFGAVVEALGVLTLLAVWINRGAISRWTRRKVTYVVAGLGTSSLISIFLYVVVYGHCVFSAPGRSPVMMPLWVSGDLAQMVEHAGGRMAAVMRYGSGAVEQAVAGMPSVAVPLTMVALLFVYQAIFTCLTAAFGIAAVRR